MSYDGRITNESLRRFIVLLPLTFGLFVTTIILMIVLNDMSHSTIVSFDMTKSFFVPTYDSFVDPRKES